MFTYAQLQAGVEADQLYFDIDEHIFICTSEHYYKHNYLGFCEDTCPFYSEKEPCGLPPEHLIRVFYSDAIRKHNPEYLL